MPIRRLWPKKIRHQLILGIAVVHVVLMSIFVFDLVGHQQQVMKDQNLSSARSLAEILAVNCAADILTNDLDGLEDQVQAHNSFPNLRYAMIFTNDDIVLAHTDKSRVGMKLSDSISQSRKKEAEPQVLLLNSSLLDIATPVFNNSRENIGWVRVGLGQQFIYENLEKVYRTGLIYILLALVIGSAFAFFMSRLLIKELNKLLHVTTVIRAGNHDVRIPASKTYEISELGTGINHMLDETKANEKLLTTVLETLPIGIWIMNKQGEVISGNTSAYKIWHGSHFSGRGVLPAFNGRYTDSGKAVDPAEWSGAKVISNAKQLVSREIEIECTDKRHRVIKNSTFPLTGSNKDIIGALIMEEDVTEKKIATEKVIKSEERFNLAIQVTRDGIWDRDLVNETYYFSPRWYEIQGFENEDPNSPPDKNAWMDRLHPDHRPIVLAKLNAHLVDKKPYEVEYLQKHKSGKYIWMRSVGQAIYDADGKPIRMVGGVSDITQRKEAEQLLLESNEQLRLLASHIEDVREEERYEIAREIHDELGQQLTALKMEVHFVKQLFDAGDKENREQVDNIIGTIDDTVETVRKISTNLRPNVLDNLGLVEALHWQCQEFEKRSGVKSVFLSNIRAVDLSRKMAIAMFRISQEALTNVSRYAGATNVSISLEVDKGELKLSVKDDGKGFDLASIKHKKTLGLVGIKERTIMMSGHCEIIAATGKGTNIIVTIPYITA